MAAYAYLLSQRDDVFSGAAIYHSLTRQKFVRESHWFNDLYGKKISESMAQFGDERRLGVEAAGEAFGLWEVFQMIKRGEKIIREG